MRPSRALLARSSPIRRAASSSPPLIQIKDATFYRQQPATAPTEDGSPPPGALFPGLEFLIDSQSSQLKHWAVIGPSDAGKTTFLEILRGQHLCFPPTARRFPYLSSDEVLKKSPLLGYPQRAIQYVGFSSRDRGLSGIGTYLSARYEARREITDFTLRDYLVGNTQLNPSEEQKNAFELVSLDKITADLRLQPLLDMAVTHLSNGQTRRARIAKALLSGPELLLLDEPFSGLDPRMTLELSPLLKTMAEEQAPRVLLSLRPQDPIPYWITHVAYLGKDVQITLSGVKDVVCQEVHDEFTNLTAQGQQLDRLPRYNQEFGRVLTDHGILVAPYSLPDTSRSEQLERLARYTDGDRDAELLEQLHNPSSANVKKRGYRGDQSEAWLTDQFKSTGRKKGDPVIEMDGVKVKYDDRVVLGGAGTDGFEAGKQRSNLWWKVRRGERWGIFGANGSGKTTLLSLITSDHPQAYSAPMKIFGRSRLPSRGQRGVSLFELQSRIGHSSPEVHSFFPRDLSVRQTLESAYGDTPLSKPRLNVVADERIDALLRWFQAEIDPKLGMYPRLKWEILHERFPDGLEDGEPYSQRKHFDDFTHRWKYGDFSRAAIWEEEVSRIESVDWAYDMKFGDLSFSSQRVVLFLRAIVSSPDIVVLDEAFGGMDDAVRDKCLLFLEYGESKFFTPKNIPTAKDAAAASDESQLRKAKMPMIEDRVPYGKRRDPILFEQGLTADQALVVVSHVREEIPFSVRNYLYLPEIVSGENYKIGKVKDRPIKFDQHQWNAIWGMGADFHTAAGKGHR